MRKTAFSILVCAYVAISAAGKSVWEKSGTDYESLTAQQKEIDLWKQITDNDKPYGWYSTLRQSTGLLAESMSPSLQWVGDTFEGSIFGVRDKFIHSVGNVALIEYTPVANNEGYTGIFASGADHGLIRLSCAKEPDTSKKTAKQAYDNFTPGFGLKFLRDGTHSGNLVAMFGVDGFESWNFFKEDFSNHIGGPTDFGLKIVAKKFATATPFIQQVGLSDIASFDKNGKKEASPHFPFQLVFEPTLKNNYPDDFETYFQDQLSAIPVGTLLYKVHAIANPGAEKVHIGDITMKTVLTSSYFGDRYLFFKHQDMQEDVKLRPEWKSHLPVGSSNIGCPVTFIKEGFNYFFKAILDTVFKGIF